MVDAAAARGHFDAERERFIAEWKNLLSIPSVSADPAHHGDCQRCADYLVAELKKIGLQSRLLPTASRPVVYAEHRATPEAPTVLFYGHYDVQPVDPLELWKSPPFTPTLRAERLYARGAQDNKGQLFYVLKAAQWLISQGELRCNLRLFIEGEEECGSEGFAAGLRKWHDDGLLKGDLLMVCDTTVVRKGVPTITMGLRGIAHLTVTVRGAKNDLHSGVHGGVAPNTAQLASRLVASLHDQNGRVSVPGFYDNVQDPLPEELRCAEASAISDVEYRQAIGVPPIGGEQGLSSVVRRGFRPTIECNGIHGGYGGPGSKTVIPAETVIKLSTRTVAGQDPEQVLTLIAEHLRRQAPDGVSVEISEARVGGVALKLPITSAASRRAEQALRALSAQPVAFLWEGASIPIVSEMARISGAEPVLVGFGEEEDLIHAPNESFSLTQLRDGFVYAALFLAACGSNDKAGEGR